MNILQKNKNNCKAFLITTFILILTAFLVFIVKPDYSRQVTHPKYPERFGIKTEIKEPLYNLLLITIDTLRPDYLSCNGYDLDTSPQIDKLIEKGLHFPKAITPIPRTTQALASLLTGCYPFETKVRYLWDSLSLEKITLAEILQRQDYRNIAVVSNHVLPPRRGLDRGFELYDFASDKRNALNTTKAAINYVKKIEEDENFFLWVHYIEPHMPYYPSNKVAQSFDPDYIGPYKNHFGGKPGSEGEDVYPEELGKEQVVFHNTLNKKVNNHIRKLYSAEIKMVDSAVYQLIKKVRDVSQENLIIVLTADHGESLGEHDYYYEHGAYVYNPGIRVPLVFILPENHVYKKAGKVNEWVSLIDVVPTLLDLMGIEIKSKHLDEISGVSLLPFWENSKIAERPLFSECAKAFFPDSVKKRVHFDIKGRFRCVISDDMKLIWTPFQKKLYQYELYDLRSDPLETNDIYRDENPAGKKLLNHLHKWMAGQLEENDKIAPEKRDLEILKSLGYIK